MKNSHTAARWKSRAKVLGYSWNGNLKSSKSIEEISLKLEGLSSTISMRNNDVTRNVGGGDGQIIFEFGPRGLAVGLVALFLKPGKLSWCDQIAPLLCLGWL